MGGGLWEWLGKTPLLFEPVPPARRSPQATANRLLDDLASSLRGIPQLCAVNVPEVLEENHEGRPFYRTSDPRDFARGLGERLGLDPVVNKVVVHLPSRGAFRRWAEETIVERGIHNVVVVGGSSGLRHYGGPTVVEASGILNELFRTSGLREGVVGNVCLPSRPDEADRLLTKTLMGGRFTTTQILFHTRELEKLLAGYDRLCREFQVPPATVVISVAPISDVHDLEFVRWLGATVPPSVEDRLLGEGSEEARRQSIRLALNVWRGARSFCRRRGLKVPLGVNVEQLSHHNLAAAVEMAGAMARALSADS
jgi:hypothetical protein